MQKVENRVAAGLLTELLHSDPPGARVGFRTARYSLLVRVEPKSTICVSSSK